MNTSSLAPESHTPRRSPPRLLVMLVTLVLVIAVVAAAILAPHLTSPASTRSGPPAPAASQVFHLAINTGGGSQDIPTYDAGQASDSASISIVNLLYDPLVTLDQDLKIENWGADQITPSSDGLTYTFHIRAGQKFTDGTAVKASDYAFSLNRTVNPCLASPVGYYLPQANLKDANAFNTETCKPDGKTIVGSIQTLIGDSIVADDSAATLTLTLSQPAGFFLDAVSYAANGVVEQSALGDGLGASGTWTDNLSKLEGNSGMFEIKSNDKAGHLKLVPNPNWWGIALGKRPHFTELDVRLFESSDNEYAAYDTQDTHGVAFDYLDTIPTADLASASRLPDFHAVPELLVQTVALNWQVPPFDNRDARQAFCLAVNRDALAAAVYPGVPVSPLRPSWHLVPQGMPGYYPQLTGVDGVTATTGDLAKARVHWAAYLATLHGKPVPAIKLSFNLGSQTQQRLASAFIAQWSAAFPGAQISNAPWYVAPPILYEQDQHHIQVFRFGWLADYPDPQDFLSLLYSSASPYNNVNANVPDADALMAAADRINDPARQTARMSAYHLAEQELVQQVATCPLYQSESEYLLRPYIVGMRQTGLGTFPNDDWLSGYIARH